VGNDGETLVADSSTSTGLRYQVGNGLAQGAINGGFDVWQRGTSFTAPAYGADRWYCSGGNATYTQESTAANLPTGFRYGMKMTMSGTNLPIIQQTIETANAIYYAGKRVVLSLYVSTNATAPIQLLLRYSNSADVAVTGSYTTLSAVSGYSSSASTTSTMTRVYCVYDVPSTAQTLQIQINSLNNLVSGNVVTVTGVQLEVGSIPTEFRRAGGTIQGELAACKYYFRRYGGNNLYESFGVGQAYAAGSVMMVFQFETGMRTTPVGSYGAASNFRVLTSTYAGVNPTSILSNTLTKNSASILLTGASSLTAGNASGVEASNSTSATIDFSAEL
jgi:hypothetical protein